MGCFLDSRRASGRALAGGETGGGGGGAVRRRSPPSGGCAAMNLQKGEEPVLHNFPLSRN